jgi:hypothetical protein
MLDYRHMPSTRFRVVPKLNRPGASGLAGVSNGLSSKVAGSPVVVPSAQLLGDLGGGIGAVWSVAGDTSVGYDAVGWTPDKEGEWGGQLARLAPDVAPARSGRGPDAVHECLPSRSALSR